MYGIVKQHEGFLDVRSEPGQGTVFHIYLPAFAGAVDPPTSPPAEFTAGGQETVLVAEDNGALRELAAVVLRSRGYNVLLASNGREALHLFRANIDDIQVVVLDVVMPQLSGPDVYAEIVELRKDLPVIFTTGHSAESASLASRVESGALFLQKPYPPHVLNRAVRTALDRRLKAR